MSQVRFESKSQAGLFFWAEPVDSSCFHVVAQATGYPASEAHDDWFANEKDAVEVARLLAQGEL